MAKTEQRYSIRIDRVPSGAAPGWVRDAWIGLTLPTRGDVGLPQKYSLKQSSVPGKGSSPAQEKKAVLRYEVAGRVAIEILRASVPTAADWWMENQFRLILENRVLLFEPSSCFLIDRGEPQEAISAAVLNGVGQIRNALLQLLDGFDVLQKQWEEVSDTDVRERVRKVIEQGFINEKSDYKLGKAFGLFTPEGNAAMRLKLQRFFDHSEVADAKSSLSPGAERLVAFQDETVMSVAGSRYDEYFGHEELAVPVDQKRRKARVAERSHLITYGFHPFSAVHPLPGFGLDDLSMVMTRLSGELDVQTRDPIIRIVINDPTQSTVIELLREAWTLWGKPMSTANNGTRTKTYGFKCPTGSLKQAIDFLRQALTRPLPDIDARFPVKIDITSDLALKDPNTGSVVGYQDTASYGHQNQFGHAFGSSKLSLEVSRESTARCFLSVPLGEDLPAPEIFADSFHRALPFVLEPQRWQIWTRDQSTKNYFPEPFNMPIDAGSD